MLSSARGRDCSLPPTSGAALLLAMSATSTSGAAVPLLETAPPPSPSTTSDSSAAPAVTRSVHFSSGNPRIEETRGVVILFPESTATPPRLPAERKPLLFVAAVPNHMTYADFCRFCGSFVQHMREIRVVRNDGMEDQSILLRFDDQTSADTFYQHFNGKKFSSLEVDVCHVLYTLDVQYKGSIEHAHSSLSSSGEQPTCPVCLERLDQDTGGILTTICNHSFHSSCISKWADSSCPVCRYCQQQPEKSTCSFCGTSENLWLCVICGFVGCGRYKEGHAIQHWKETQHCYSFELETQRVWNYVEDNYVHRLIRSKTDGEVVEMNFHCAHVDDMCGNCECNTDSGISEALFNSRVEAIVEEYNRLLASQLEDQKKHYESLLQESSKEIEKEISFGIAKSGGSKVKKLQLKLEKHIEEKMFLDNIHEHLLENQDTWKTKTMQIEERERTLVSSKDKKIKNLEEQLSDLIVRVETQTTADEHSGTTLSCAEDSSNMLPAQKESSSHSGSTKKAAKSRRRS